MSEWVAPIGKLCSSSPGDVLIFLDELRDHVDVLPTSEHLLFMDAFFPWAIDSLNVHRPNFSSTSNEYRLRHAILEILRIVPNFGEVTRPFIDSLMKVALVVIEGDCEENGLIALHIMVDLHKLFRTSLESYVQPLLDIVLRSLDNFEQTSNMILTKRPSSDLLPASSSFKLLIECPVMVVLLFQLHRRFINDNIPKFVPVVLKALSVEAAAPDERDSTVDSLLTLPDINNELLGYARTMYNDFVAAQVKILSFLAYISRGFCALIKPHQKILPQNVIRLLSSCPPECASSRKELLVATRHILSTEVRHAFIPYLEPMMDSRLLLGEGYTAFHVFRPMSLSMLADLIHHVRQEIESDVLLKIIIMYSKALHDATLPFGIQTMSAKLLVNLVDSILGNKVSTENKRKYLMRLITAFVYKFEWIKNFVNELYRKKLAASTSMTDSFDEKTYDPFYDDPFHSRTIHSDLLSIDGNKDNCRDIKFLLRTLIGGIKGILFALKAILSNGEEDAASSTITGCGLSIVEGREFVSLFEAGIHAFEIFNIQNAITPSPNSKDSSSIMINTDGIIVNPLISTTIPSEEKEVMDQFAYIFTLIEPHIFQDVVNFNLEMLIKKINTNLSLITIPQYFLAISGISRNFASLVIKYLMEHIDELSSVSSTESAIILRLFKLVFLAVSVYPDENENVLQPYLSDLILACLRNHHKSANSVNYFLLLRSLFRSIGGGRFDSLYKEVLPLLPILLEELSKLPFSTTDPQLRDLYVELCLTTPVRLSVLLPFLSFLMKPLVLALESNTELVNQGLRTLELCVDNLTQDFLEPILSPVLPDVLSALWRLLRPSPANQNYSHAAIRILGKMGGRCRRYYMNTTSQTIKPLTGLASSKASLPLSINIITDLNPNHGILLNIDSATRVALNTLADVNRDGQLRDNALSLIFYAIYSICGNEVLIKCDPYSQADKNSLANYQLTRNVMMEQSFSISQVNARIKNRLGATEQLHFATVYELNDIEQESIEQLSFQLFNQLFLSINHCEFADRIKSFIEGLFRMFCVYETKKPCIERYLIVDNLIKGACIGLVQNLASKVTIISEFCLLIIELIYQTTIKASIDRLYQEYSIISMIAEKLISICYHPSLQIKMGACQGLSLLCKLEPPLAWIWQYEGRFVRGIFYIMKSLNHGEAIKYGEELSRCLYKVIKFCNRQVSTEDEVIKSKRQQYYSQLVALLVLELANSNGIVRNATQISFQLLADALGSEVTEIISPLKDRLLNPIFSKPLRALPLQIQTGYIDAVTYCLSLRPPILDISDELLRLLNEAIALADAEDHALSGKSNQLYTSTNINNLRVVCIKVLSAALSCADFQHPKLQQLRNLIVSVFFKSLYSKSSDVVEASRKALEQIISHQHKLPKDLLQTGLRPVLMNLAETKRLSIIGLEGLKRVLLLLTSYFKAEIGKKLLDHLASWSDVRVLEESRGKPLSELIEIKAISSLLDVFHLLPHSSFVFDIDLVNAVIELEKTVQRDASSPFRLPLVKFLAHHPVESVQFILDNSTRDDIWTLFSNLLTIQSQVSQPLMLELQKRLMDFFNQFDNATNYMKRTNALRIIEMSLSSPLEAREDGYSWLFVRIERAWQQIVTDASIENIPEKDLQLRQLMSIVKSYITWFPTCSDAPFLLLECFNVPFIVEFSDIPQFFCTSWIPFATISGLKNALNNWLNYMQQSKSFIYKARITRLITLPIIAFVRSKLDPKEVFNHEFFVRLSSVVLERDFKPNINGACVIAVEELQVIQALLEIPAIIPQQNSETWIKIRQFLFSRILSLDPTVRYMSLCIICNNILYFDVKDEEAAFLLKIVLKMPTSETRPLIRQCLDKLFCAVDTKEHVKSQLVDLLGKTLSRETNMLSLIIVIWQIILSKQAEFSSVAHLLLKNLIVSLSRCSLNVFAIVENRSLPLDVFKVILSWNALDNCKPLWQRSTSLYDYSINAIFRLLSAANEFSNDKMLFEKAMSLIVEALKCFPAHLVRLKFAVLEKLIMPDFTDENFASIAIMGLKVLDQVLGLRPLPFYFKELKQVERVLGHALSSSSPAMLEPLCSIINVYYENVQKYVANLEKMDEINYLEFHSFLSSFIGESFANGRDILVALNIVQIQVSLSSKIKSLLDIQTEPLVNQIAKGFSTIVHEMFTKQEPAMAETQKMASFFASAIKILTPHLASPTFNRQPILSSLRLLWQKSTLPTILQAIIQALSNVFQSTSPFPTLKEKTDIMLLPTRALELDNTTLSTLYFDLIVQIFSIPTYQGSELTWRLETAFLKGLVHKNVELRQKFFALLNTNLPNLLFPRLLYIFGVQNWFLLGTWNWIPAINCLLFSLFKCFEAEPKMVHTFSSTKLDHISVLNALSLLCYEDDNLSHDIFVSILPQMWKLLNANMRKSLSKLLSKLLTSEEYLCTSRMRPSPFQSILESLSYIKEDIDISPAVIAYVAKYYSTWHSSIVILENLLLADGSKDVSLAQMSLDEPALTTKQVIVDLLKHLYKNLGEVDMKTGLIRRQTTFIETNAALSFLQGGKWGIAQKLMEQVQHKARNGSINFSDSEYSTWEQTWIECAKRLQQWDILAELAKVDEDYELSLECSWRMADWNQIDAQISATSSLNSCPIITPRTKFLEAFLFLNQKDSADKSTQFQASLEEAVQLSLSEWMFLPSIVSFCHLPLLENFQLFVEIQEALTIYLNLSSNGSMLGRPQFLSDLKGLLSTWRERLPNKNDDVNVWSDLLAWRQHVFTTLNVAFQPLISQDPSQPSQTSQHPFAFRGYHEMAWLINRFSRIARKNKLIDVCLSFLHRIYTLPNIEIQDAFLKLREQAKCYMEIPADLPTALEVINATNLNYFNGTQKGEFFALKAVVLARLGMLEEANRVFAQAVQIDLNIGRGWSGWGYFNDQRFLQSQELNFAVNAVNCYLQAAALFKVEYSRKYLARILWLFTFEDLQGNIGKSFELYNNDLPTWYWVFFIPQLLLSLTRRDIKQAKFVLIKIAKSFPQALFVPLRAFNEELRHIYGNRQLINVRTSNGFEKHEGPLETTPQEEFSQKQESQAVNQPASQSVGQSISQTVNQSISQTANQSVSQSISQPTGQQVESKQQSREGLNSETPTQTSVKRMPLDHLDDVLAVLKTGYPLLTLSMETIIENIVQRLRSSADEDFYRVIVTLIAEGYQQMVLKFNSVATEQPNVILNGLEFSLKRVSFMLSSAPYLANTYKAEFDKEFLDSKCTLREVLTKLHNWRQKLLPIVINSHSQIPLETLSRVLSEIEYQSYDEIDIFGQYNLLKDSPNDFVKIERFEPMVQVVRHHGTSYRRIRIRGHDGSVWKFVVQNPSARQSRREERIMQFLYIMDNNSKHGIATRSRGLKFSIPLITPISAHVRLIVEDPDLISFEDIMNQGLCSKNISPDDLILYYNDSLTAEISRMEIQLKKGNSDLLNLRTDLYQVISPKFVDVTILQRFMASIATDQNSFWNFRQALIRQYSTCIFSAYVLAFGHRYLHKTLLSKKMALITQSDLLPTLNPNGQITLMEAVPVRLGPNLQDYFTETGIEGVLVPAIHAIAEVLAVTESDTSEYAALFVRDELIIWLLASQQSVMDETGEFVDDLTLLERQGIDERQLLGRIMQNCELVMKRVHTLACIREEEKALEAPVPYYQTILDLLSCATNPQKLALMDPHWHPWF